jgi:hypothetical protein
MLHEVISVVIYDTAALSRQLIICCCSCQGSGRKAVFRRRISCSEEGFPVQKKDFLFRRRIFSLPP